MSGTLLLAGRYLAHHRWRTLLLVLALGAMLLLPLTVRRLVETYGERLGARAAATPLVVGAPGSRYDLVLSSLYFRGRVPAPTNQGQLEQLLEGGLGLPIPLLARRTAAGHPVVGTSLDYFDFRGLEPERGELPVWLGEAVLGAEVARELGLGPGDTLLSDRGNLYDLASATPLKLNVVGVLAPAAKPDDRAVFVDVRTAWILEGLGHGHDDTLAPDEQLGAATRTADGQALETANASVVEATEITPENVDTFHFHDAPERLPLTGILVAPASAKEATLLKGRYRVDDSAQLLEPTLVVDELLGFVFRAKAFFDANALLVGAAAALLFGLVILLDLRVRRDELRTLARIGIARATVAGLVATEILAVLVAAAALAALGSLAATGLLEAWQPA